MNRIGVIIQARMGSSRLPGKILLELSGKPVLQRVVERCKQAAVDEVIVATTTSEKDDEVASFCTKNGIPFYRGSEDDVLGRYYACAKEFMLDEVVRVTSDCPLIDPHIIDNLIKKYREEDADYARIDTDTFPRGFDAEVLSFNLLESIHRIALLKEDREHVTLYIRKNPARYKNTNLVNSKNLSYIRLTLDTRQDYEVLKKVLAKKEDIYLPDVEILFKDHPDWLDINKSINQKTQYVKDGSNDRIHINDNHYLEKNEYGFWQVRPTPTKDFLTDFYKNNYADALEKINVEDKIASLGAMVRNKTVMDIGCGDGALLKEFKKKGWKVSGIEPSEKLSQDEDLNIIHGSFEAMSQFEKVDAVILNYVLEHHPDPVGFLKKIHDDVLNDEGVILVEVPNDFNAFQAVCDESCGTGKYWVAFPDHLNYFGFESLQRLLETSGFEILKKESSFPMEMFILMGENYIKDKSLGKEAHKKRVAFENNLIKSGRNDLKQDMYRKLSELNIGRSVLMYARKKKVFSHMDETYGWRDLTFEDLLPIKVWRNDQMDILRQNKMLSDADQINYWERIRKSDRERLFAINDSDNRLIGYCGLVNIDKEYGKAEISFLLNPEIKEGTGIYADIFKRSLRFLTQFAFESLGLHRVFTETYSFRKAHRKILESCGFLLEGRLKESVIKNGVYFDSLVHAIISKDNKGDIRV